MKQFFFWLFQLPIQIALQAGGVFMVRYLTGELGKAAATPENAANAAKAPVAAAKVVAPAVDAGFDVTSLLGSTFSLHLIVGGLILISHYAWVSKRRLYNPRLAAMPIWTFFTFLLLLTLSFCARQMSMPTIAPSDNPQAHVSPTGRIIVR